MDRPRLQALIEERALAQDSFDSARVAKVREDMERAEARRLQAALRGIFLSGGVQKTRRHGA